MGEFLSHPNKDKHSDDGENSFVRKNLLLFYIIIIVKIWLIRYARMEKKARKRPYICDFIRR